MDSAVLGDITGDGRWRRDAASFSPGASNATTGTPKVAPRRDAIEPPRECPGTYYINANSAEAHETCTNLSAIYWHLDTYMSHCCKDSADKLEQMS